MVGCSSWAGEEEAAKQRSNEVMMNGNSAQRWVVSFMASFIGDHSGREMPSGTERW